MSCLEGDFRPVFRDLRWGVYVVFEAPTDYAAACFAQYGLRTDASGRYAAMYKPYHLIGLELNVSVLSAALRGEPTGVPDRLAGRRRGGGQARPAGRRGARRRGRLHGLGPAAAGGRLPGARRPAPRPRPRRGAARRRGGRPAGALGRRGPQGGGRRPPASGASWSRPAPPERRRRPVQPVVQELMTARTEGGRVGACRSKKAVACSTSARATAPPSRSRAQRQNGTPPSNPSSWQADSNPSRSAGSSTWPSRSTTGPAAEAGDAEVVDETPGEAVSSP